MEANPQSAGQAEALAEMLELLRSHDLCVLATSRDDRPYCSLMAYAVDEQGIELYLATLRSTRKFAHLAANPAVSLMIDTRGETVRPQVRALTVEGECRPITDRAEEEAVRARLLARHPHLRALLADGDCALLRVRLQGLLLLKGIEDARYVRIEKPGAGADNEGCVA